MASLVTVTREENIAVVALNNPPVNALSHPVRVALLAALEELFADATLGAIVIACEGRTFVAGADIREFGKAPLLPDLPDVIEFLDKAPQLTVAAIHGTALGGGLELALACHFRVATPSAKLGLPEVTLGILPGAGGTQRLPRLIGVRPALELIVSGVPISAAQAQRLGIVDELGSDDVKASAVAFARRALAEGRRARRASELSATEGDAGELAEYERGIAQRWRGFLAPFRCVEAVRAAVELPFAEGLERERALFRELMASAESAAQRHVFFGEREVAKVPGLPEETPTRPVKSVVVVGAGALASGLAKCFTDARMAVTLLGDSAEELAAASSADLLLEAVAENADEKRATLARLGSVAKPGAILASTTSFLDLDALAGATGRPSDFVGMRFATPLEQMKLLEVVPCQRTATDAYATVMKLGRALGKIAVPVRAHVANRLLTRRNREIGLLLEEGASRGDIDAALVDFGFPTGPFAELGSSTLAGSHAEKGAAAVTDPSVAALLESPRNGRGGRGRSVSAEEIRDRCLYAVVNEAARVLDEGLAARALDIDMIWVHGHAFPVYRGGPLFFADQVGLSVVHQHIQRYRAEVGEEYWSPAPRIERLAKEQGRFYGKT
ncbi:MAG TPA: enoyl-CoA hydratase-related protein [Polyangiaceae bacterium]|nr:enoyl-CoA hydratase-related protein [Polyangiaceae bacterium]